MPPSDEMDEEDTKKKVIKDMDFIEDKTLITQLGRALSFIPIAPRFAKMILMGRKEGIMGYAMLIASGLSVEEIFQTNAPVIESKFLS